MSDAPAIAGAAEDGSGVAVEARLLVEHLLRPPVVEAVEVLVAHQHGLEVRHRGERRVAAPVRHVLQEAAHRHSALLDAPARDRVGADLRGVVGVQEQRRDHVQALRAAAARRPVPVLGITGTGGSGKSSLTDELLRRFRVDQEGKLRIAVIAVDPTRRKGGGALLGDRIRMNAIGPWQKGSRIFMRSLATRDFGSEISAALPDVMAGREAQLARWRTATPALPDVRPEHRAFAAIRLAVAAGIMASEGDQFAPGRDEDRHFLPAGAGGGLSADLRADRHHDDADAGVWRNQHPDPHQAVDRARADARFRHARGGQLRPRRAVHARRVLRRGVHHDLRRRVVRPAADVGPRRLQPAPAAGASSRA